MARPSTLSRNRHFFRACIWAALNPRDRTLSVSNPLKLYPSSQFSHRSPPPSTRRIGEKYFASASTLFSQKFSSWKDGYFFCSQSKSNEKFCRCWNCDAEATSEIPFLFCDACRCVQPVNCSIDYFKIFGLEKNSTIDIEELDRKYKDWQKKIHPDLVHSKSQREREYASEQSSRVTDAFRTLADSLLRAIYIMKLEGVVVDEEERITDLELLAEIMELREAVEDAEGSEALNQIQIQLHSKLLHCYGLFKDAVRSKRYEDAMTSIRRMAYYKRASEQIVMKL